MLSGSFEVILFYAKHMISLIYNNSKEGGTWGCFILHDRHDKKKKGMDQVTIIKITEVIIRK